MHIYLEHIQVYDQQCHITYAYVILHHYVSNDTIIYLPVSIPKLHKFK